VVEAAVAASPEVLAVLVVVVMQEDQVLPGRTEPPTRAVVLVLVTPVPVALAAAV
tara:strand:- start:659 stop:823 length:165 start_codon:yes stop_codon:yes gene_type:complete